MNLLEPSSSKEALDMWLWHCQTALRSCIYQDVCLSCPTTGMYAGKPLLTMGNKGHLSTCGNFYVVVKRNWVLRGFHCSESVVLFHLVFWMSSFSVVVLVFVWFWGLLLVFAIEDIRLFAFHLFSYNLRIVDRPQDVLMTVRASSANGMSYKKSRYPWQRRIWS